MLAIHYPNAVWDEAEQRLISDAEIAEVPFTAFTSRRTAEHISGRLIVRRVKRLNPTAKTATSAAGGDRQGELFALYRYHAVFTDSPLPLVQAEKTHRAHAIIEQVHADLRSGPLAHLPSGFVRGEQRLAGAGRDRVQPHPRRRLPGLGLPRQSHHLHHPRPADQHPGSAGSLGPPPADAPSAALAVGAGLVPAVPGHPGTTPTGLTRPPADRPNRNRSGKAGQTGPAGTPTPGVKIRTPSQTRSNVARCIQAEVGLALSTPRVCQTRPLHPRAPGRHQRRTDPWAVQRACFTLHLQSRMWRWKVGRAGSRVMVLA